MGSREYFVSWFVDAVADERNRGLSRPRRQRLMRFLIASQQLQSLNPPLPC
jgi:hypothetical protein